MKKRIVSMFLAAMMAFSTSAAAVSAEENYYEQDSATVYTTYEPENPTYTRAAEIGYTSTLEMSANSRHQGAMRSYLYDNFKCILTDMDLFDWENDYTYVNFDVSVVKGNVVTGYKELGSTTLRINKKVSTQTADIGYCGKGSRAFVFRTHTSGVRCNDVNMKTY